MGTWGTGLYDGDEAQDLKILLNTLLSLPYSIPEIVEIAAAEVEGDEDRIVFDLVLADVLERKGVRDTAAYGRAIQHLTEGADKARFQALEMSAPDLAKRRKVQDALLARLQSPRPEKPRKTLKAAKPIPVEAGDLIAYPVDAKGPVNPYLSAKLLERLPFDPIGWNVVEIAGTGHCYGYLPWVAVRRVLRDFQSCPAPASLAGAPLSDVLYGTLPSVHFKKLGMRKIGVRAPLVHLPPIPIGQATPKSVTISDISISNALRRPDPERPFSN